MAEKSTRRLKNLMLFGNLVTNAISLVIYYSIVPNAYIEFINKTYPSWLIPITSAFDPAIFVVAALITIRYERPIRRSLDAMAKGAPVSPEKLLIARRRLLNEPFVLMGLDLLIWFFASTFFLVLDLTFGMEIDSLYRLYKMALITGLINAVIAFFVLEHHLQKYLAPRFFPEGRLSEVPGAVRIRIPTRLVVLFLACNVIPFLGVLSIVGEASTLGETPGAIVQELTSLLRSRAVLFMATGLLLTLLVSSNLRRPLQDIIDVLKGVHAGDLERRVTVTTNDEIGYTGDVINEMTEGLKERERMRRSLELARQVQTSLLPRRPPEAGGLDVAGRSDYCDETGGDYFDFLEPEDDVHPGLGVVVGDVSGHGLESALLMTTARAFLRLRTGLPGDAARVVADVNRQLARDVEDSGQFMTLFYMRIEPETGRLCWVRAGHDPALLYSPATDTFEELKGEGLALGVMEDWEFEENERPLAGGEILAVGTDGIWEAHNAAGEMFGKAAFREVIRRSRDLSAAETADAVFEAVAEFRGDLPPEDDVTLVVIKYTNRRR
jgi:sigma-B regulation protein RsbU (phosphoserine phosphatase)